MANNFRYGGQAVMEGVMMRGQKVMATVVRRPDGTLAKEIKPLHPIYTGRWRRTPLLRGVIALLEALLLGTSALMYSANVALEDIDGDKKKDEGGEGAKKTESSAAVWIIIIISMGLGVGLFFLLPLFLTRLITQFTDSAFVFNLVEGLVRLGIFLGYLWLVAFMPDIRRVFSYHGAEHKTIHAYEEGVELTPQNVQIYTTAHARCGTAFLLAVMIIAILVFTLVGKPSLWVMVASRILLLPVIAALAYEVTQFGARHLNNPFIKALMAPGLWLQGLTTRQPDDRMVEVAIVALQEALIADGVVLKAATNPSSPLA
jgi:uncharacterized protein YqhQ